MDLGKGWSKQQRRTKKTRRTVSSLDDDCLLITSSVYKQDVLNLLCLPEGMHYRFRYRESWVPEELMKEPSSLKGKKGLIIYYYEAVTGEVYQEFVPVREIIMDSVERLGDILYVKFITGKFLTYEPRENEAHPNPYNQLIKKTIQAYLSTSRPYLEKYIMISKHLPILVASDQMAGWSSLIRWLFDMEPFINVSFLKIVRIIDQKGTEVVSKNIVRGQKVKSKGYILQGGKTFQIELAQRTNDNLTLSKSFAIKLKASESIIPIRNPLVVGKYDKLETVFVTKYQLNDAYTAIALEASEQVQATINKKTVVVESPDPYLPVKIKRMSFKRPISLIVLGVVPVPILRLLMWSEMVKFIGVEIVRLSELELAVIGALGLLAVAFGAALFRRVI